VAAPAKVWRIARDSSAVKIRETGIGPLEDPARAGPPTAAISALARNPAARGYLAPKGPLSVHDLDLLSADDGTTTSLQPRRPRCEERAPRDDRARIILAATTADTTPGRNR
jgi:hypothetical protein